MNKKNIVLLATLLITITAAPGAARAHDACSGRALSALIHRASPQVGELVQAGCAAIAAGKTDAGLGLLEEGMRRSVSDPATFGMLQSVYWPEIGRLGRALRAVVFFRALALRHPKNPEVLAAAGNALGMALPELAAASAPSMLASLWVKDAEAFYAKALSLDPESFSALLGRAIFTSYLPGRFPEAKQQFQKLLALRRTYPKRHYPWGVAYVQWARAAARNGHPKEAEKILDEARSALPGDPIVAHASLR
ncbi:MAG: hypothetical protein GXP48_01920 [Acidobacteria bacterium]|nr:hypothetical protein [Acidobacteriota bacterium]